MKAVVAAFNQEKALVGAFSVIVQFHRLIVCCTNINLVQPHNVIKITLLIVPMLLHSHQAAWTRHQMVSNLPFMQLLLFIC